MSMALLGMGGLLIFVFALFLGFSEEPSHEKQRYLMFIMTLIVTCIIAAVVVNDFELPPQKPRTTERVENGMGAGSE